MALRDECTNRKNLFPYTASRGPTVVLNGLEEWVKVIFFLFKIFLNEMYFKLLSMFYKMQRNTLIFIHF